MNKSVEMNESLDEGKELETPPKKKLKQARLPFQILSSAVKPTSPPLKNSNKRKLSESSDDIKVVKIVKPNGTSPSAEIKENVCSAVSKSLTLGAVSKTSSEHASNKKNKDGDEENDEVKGKDEKKRISKPDKGKIEKSQPAHVIVLSDSEAEAEIKEAATVVSSSKKLDDAVKESVDIDVNKVMADAAVCDSHKQALMDVNDKVKVSKKTLQKKKKKKSNANNKVVPDKTVDISEEENINEKEESSEKVVPRKKRKKNANDKIEVSDKELQKEKSNANNIEVVSDKISQKDSIPSSSINVTPKQKKEKSQLKEVTVTPKEACGSTQTTPKSGSPSSSGESPNADVSTTAKIKKLTPKQLQKQLESAKKREEKERQRQEREKKKAEEKEERLKQKQEKEEQRRKEKEEKEEQKKKEREEKEEQKRKEKEEKEEQKRKEKEEKEEQKRKEREEKEKKKQLEIEQRNEEKRAKDEEKRRKEEQRQAEAAAFTSFFLPKKSEVKVEEETVVKCDKTFMPFEVKADMRLAPNCRVTFTSELQKTMDEIVAAQSKKQLYLDELRNKKRTPRTSSKTWSLSDFKNDIIILDEEDEMDVSESNNIIETHPAIGKLPRPKLLQFWENRRPPYWGTWRKKSKAISPLTPFGKDEKLFDYEVDSDDEWEEEEPGESLHGSDDEKESEDEYEVDNEFFVPHGYLSDEENEEDDQTPEMQKTKLKLLELEFEEEMKQKTERLKPRLIGCIWIDPKMADSAGGQLLKLLSPYTAIYNDSPILTHASELGNGCASPESQPASPTNSAIKRRKFPEAAIPTLIKLIHGNVNRREFLVKEFLAHWCKELNDSIPEDSSVAEDSAPPKPYPSGISKASVSNKIKELATWVACPDEGAIFGRMCWYVPEEARLAHGLSDLVVPNTWAYICKPRKHEGTENQTANPNVPTISESTPKQLITKFTKVMSENERKKQFEVAANSKSPDIVNNTSNSLTSKAPRKLIFPSGLKSHTLKEQAPGQQQKTSSPLSTSKNDGRAKATNNILTKYIKTQNKKEKKHLDVKTKKPLQTAEVQDDCIVVSD